MATPARRLAVRILDQVEQGGSTLADCLSERAVEALPSRERGFLHELVLGTLRTRGALDHALTPLLDRPLSRLDRGVRAALRLGAYQILRLRVPDRAAVSESVDLARESAPRAAGLVNAVLRRLVREGPPGVPDPTADPLAWLTTEGSLPRWLAERWMERLGPATAVARARAFLEPPPTVFRANPRTADAWARIQAAGLAPRPSAVPAAWEATAGHATDLAAESVIYIQDQGSQMAAHLAANDGLLLDACAAPGGKATLLGDLVGERGWIVAAESSARRLATLASLVRRWGSSNVRALGADALRPPFRASFDAVLLDAPCSGLGTIARRPDIRWRATARDLDGHARSQRDLLERLAPLVKAGGKLVYSTCSVEPEESQGVVDGFLEVHPEFRRGGLPDWAMPFADGGFAWTSPERDGGDAFFAAPLRRE